MVEKPERNAFTHLAFAISEAVAEIGAGAVADIRNRWEEAWFGRPLTPETGGSLDRFADRVDDLTGRLDTAISEVRGLAREVEPMVGRVEASWSEMCAQLAKERGYRQGPEHEHEHSQEIDR